MQLPAHQVEDAGARALVGHVQGLDAAHHVEEFARQVHGGAAAGRREIELARLLLRQRDQLLRALHRQRRMHAQDQRGGRHHRDRREIPLRVPGEPGVQALVGGEKKRPHQYGVAIRGAAGDVLGGHIPAGADPVLDRDLPPEVIGKLGGEAAGDHVARAPRRECIDQPDRPRRVRLGVARHREKHAEEQDAGTRHHQDSPFAVSSFRRERHATSGLRGLRAPLRAARRAAPRAFRRGRPARRADADGLFRVADPQRGADFRRGQRLYRGSGGEAQARIPARAEGGAGPARRQGRGGARRHHHAHALRPRRDAPRLSEGAVPYPGRRDGLRHRALHAPRALCPLDRGRGRGGHGAHAVQGPRRLSQGGGGARAGGQPASHRRSHSGHAIGAGAYETWMGGARVRRDPLLRALRGRALLPDRRRHRAHARRLRHAAPPGGIAPAHHSGPRPAGDGALPGGLEGARRHRGQAGRHACVKRAVIVVLAALAAWAQAAEPLSWRGATEITAGRGERGPWRMNESRFDYVDDPSVAVDERGDSLVVWVDQALKDVLFQQVSAAGVKRGEPVNVSRSPATFSWLPRIALSPREPGAVFVLWQEIIFSGGSHGGDILFARSGDGGRTFSAPLNLSDSIAGDGKGRINKDLWHNGSLDLVAEGSSLYAAWTEYEGALWLRRSGDGGKSFNEKLRIPDAKPARAPSLAAQRNNVYLAWTVGDDDSADIRVATSKNAGTTFRAPVIVERSKGYSDAPKLALDERGVLHLVYSENSRILYSRSTDGGASFERPRDISGPGAGFPSLSADANGNLYVLWERFERRLPRPRGLQLAVSRDGGRTFAGGEVPESAGAGWNGSLQGMLMRKLAVNRGGGVAIVNSTLKENDGSRAWLMRGRLAP